MTKKELRCVLKDHTSWIKGAAAGKRADLQGADLRDAHLQRAKLRGAHLQGADLQGADLRDAHLQRAKLRGADLQDADLRDADLQDADLRDADLQDADLRGAKLQGADLQRANIQGADLRGAIGLCPPVMLLAIWGAVSDNLCVELMRYDASNCPDGTTRFNAWAYEGLCPYRETKVTRSVNFQEKRTLWSPGPSLSALELMERLIEEKCNRKGASDGYEESAAQARKSQGHHVGQ